MSNFLIAPWAQPQSVQSVLITPMSEDLFTPDEALLRAGLTWAIDDPRRPMVTDWIKAAQQKVEQDTGLALLTQVREVTVLSPTWGWTPLPAQCTPTQAIEDVIGVSVVARIGPQPRYALAPGFTGTLRVTAGWVDKADFKVRAPLLYQAVGVLLAHYATAGRDLVITGAIEQEMIQGYAEMIASAALVWIP